MNTIDGKRDWSAEELTTLRGSLRGLMEREGLKAAEVARRAAIGEATLSQFLNDKYNGDNSRVARDLARWMEAYEREREFRVVAPPEPTFVQTPTAQRVYAALQHAQLLSDMAVLVGPPGVGKSAALDQYAVSTPRVYKLTASPSSGTTSAILSAFMLKYSPHGTKGHGSRHHKSLAVRAMLSAGALLAVDEAQHLNTDALEELRAIHDETRCGLVLMGNRTVLTRIEGNRRDPAYAQLFSRAGWRVELKKGDDGDVRPVLETMGVTAPEIIAQAVKIAAKENLRVVIKVIRSAQLLANGNNENLDVRHVRAGYRQLTGDASGSI